MDSKELYAVLLGVRTPWTVAAVEMNVAKQEVVVTVAHPAGTRFCCPQCERELAVFDHLAERRWRHLDSCQFMTYLQARPPRVHCPEHGKRAVALPWAEGQSRFTTMFVKDSPNLPSYVNRNLPTRFMFRSFLRSAPDRPSAFP